MATFLTPQPPRPTLFDLIVRALYILIPVALSSFATYKQTQSEASAGYKALVETTVKLQAEVAELHEKDREQDKQTAKLEEAFRFAEEGPEPVQVFDAGQPVHPLTPPPATLQEAVRAAD